MKTKKTYGIAGLLEWHGIVESNGVQMRVPFTNGSTTAFGVAPATYTTADELTQHIIEDSEQFKKGRIRVVRVVELEEPKKAAKAADKLAAPGEKDKSGRKPVEVADEQEAKEWLKDNYGYTLTALRSRASFESACKESGVEFVYTA